MIELNDAVKVIGVRGMKPTDTYKVAVNYISGYKANGKLTVTAPYAKEKATKIGQVIIDRLKNNGIILCNNGILLHQFL